MKHVSDCSKPWQNTGNRALFDTQPQQSAYATMANPGPVMAKSRPSMMAMRVITNTHPTRTRPCPSPTKTGTVLPKPTKRANQPTNPPLQSKNQPFAETDLFGSLQMLELLTDLRRHWLASWLEAQPANQQINQPINHATNRPSNEPTNQRKDRLINQQI